ncbi:hypothetical protein DHB74_08370 [Pseudomonas sp. G11-1]|uniref:Flagellar protein FlgN n=1 Tax=Halopseudomonas bauzanensis TaxID=653930 RepID=A0A4U0YM94_9GAMM|nr:flagellar protein FlgN [Halopseudomonas bauzanensis]MCO5786363.1 hypothetical protein [Pseudomonas sp. G11-1]MCO5789589.1 hypothetical protein [Pseudomonas sp. G11-2]TKA92458.1 flagellar protein FlgN [Halopseudomonas bauzanensis]
MQDLSALFAQATQHCEQFAELLDQEHQVLLDQDMDALDALTKAKTPLIAVLVADEQALSAQCETLSKPASQSLTDFIGSLDNPALAAQHTDFLTAAERCQNANLRNARLIRHSQHINSRLLDLLRNQGEASQNVYDRQGNASRSASGRPISRA